MVPLRRSGGVMPAAARLPTTLRTWRQQQLVGPTATRATRAYGLTIGAPVGSARSNGTTNQSNDVDIDASARSCAICGASQQIEDPSFRHGRFSRPAPFLLRDTARKPVR
jgi:hypothetical protein